VTVLYYHTDFACFNNYKHFLSFFNSTAGDLGSDQSSRHACPPIQAQEKTTMGLLPDLAHMKNENTSPGGLARKAVQKWANLIGGNRLGLIWVFKGTPCHSNDRLKLCSQ
jgi:hypothetical protein